MDEAEERMISIEKKILELEKLNSQPSDSEAIKSALVDYQRQMLTRLQSVRNSLLNEIGDISTVRSERDAALIENLQMKKEIERLNYRVQHLVKALNEEEKKNEKI
jgi:phage host-nuclease inhibitor protein Gam